MKKKIVLVIMGLIIVAALVVAWGFSFTESRSVTIDAPVDIVAPQVSGLPNWKKWYGEDAGRLSFVSGGPVSIVVRDTGRSFEEAVAVVPQMDGRSTRVVWSRPVTVWQRLAGADAGMTHHLAALKNYIEDARSYYGFDIHIRQVTDTLFATRDDRVAEAAVAARRVALLERLEGYLRAHPEMKCKDSVITGYESISGGQVHLVVGIPVDRRMLEADSVRFLTLPRGGRLLSGECGGDSVGLEALKRAMDRYVADKRLQLVAIPFTERRFDGSGGYELNYPIW